MRISVVVLALFLAAPLMAQQEELNPNSVDPISPIEYLYKLRVWRDVDLREKSNQGFFSNNGEISRLFLEAVRSGEIDTLYTFDSLQYTKNKQQIVFSREDLRNAMMLTQGKNYSPWDSSATKTYVGSTDTISYKGNFYACTLDAGPPDATTYSPLTIAELRTQAKAKGIPFTPKTTKTALVNALVAAYVPVSPDKDATHWQIIQSGKVQYYGIRDIAKFRVMEDLIFDRRRSRLYHDIQAIQFFVIQSDGKERSLGWVKYKDLNDVFKRHPRESVWFNRENPAQNKKFADAFKLRLFKSTLWKVENPEDSYIQEILQRNGRSYKESVLALEWEEMRLMEKEHNLWEY